MSLFDVVYWFLYGERTGIVNAELVKERLAERFLGFVHGMELCLRLLNDHELKRLLEYYPEKVSTYHDMIRGHVEGELRERTRGTMGP